MWNISYRFSTSYSSGKTYKHTHINTGTSNTKSKVSTNLRETKGYSPGFFFLAVLKKVLRKVNHFKVLEKRN